jgi:hypothetical protein
LLLAVSLTVAKVRSAAVRRAGADLYGQVTVGLLADCAQNGCSALPQVRWRLIRTGAV